MKKIILLISSLFVVSVLVSCQQNEEPKQTTAKQMQHDFPKDEAAIVTSLKIEMVSIKDASKSLPKGENLKEKKLMKVKMKIGNMTEYNIPMAASFFKALDSNGKYQLNYPMVDELGETISGDKVIHGAVYFAIPKDRVIEKIVYEDPKRDAFYEWAVEK
ncbi:hypothetical protein DUK53_04260 [Listeria sp. SHR_NRA_18]|uniref:hypothetical protein n=1 Tax=Listeria sp. SHR_NRA_18 TaxID=2269046 RepID=UPI00051DF8BC|nr:hypothetical protein [Listeria sp. SHR_NRA_18]KGL42482.1 hypothetical protein EP56_09740 [Listeriaceae bacterium FSL A5-0209]RQW67538.1 hypothetical protein DUK53_04260 [Listeria sp. SHR_NRA_18]